MKESREQNALYIKLQQFIFLCAHHEKIESGCVGMNGIQRKGGNFTLAQPLDATVFDIGVEVALHSVTFSVDLLTKTAGAAMLTLDAEELADSFKKQFLQQVFVVKQNFVMDFNGKKLSLNVDQFDHAAVVAGAAASTSGGKWGQVIGATECNFKKLSGSTAANSNACPLRSPKAFSNNAGLDLGGSSTIW